MQQSMEFIILESRGLMVALSQFILQMFNQFCCVAMISRTKSPEKI